MNKCFIFIYLYISIAGCYCQTKKNLVGNFTFNEGEAINEVTGKTVRSPSVLFLEDRFGNPKSACYLHGSHGSFINLGVDSSLKPSKGTIAVWIKIEIVMYGGKGIEVNPIITTKNQNGDDFCEAYSIAYLNEGGKAIASCSESEKLQVQLLSPEPISIHKWHHLALSYDDDSLHLYVDGSLCALIAKNYKTIFSPTDSILVGAITGKKNERYFCGSVDDIMIYNRVLSRDEIADIYNAPNPNTVKNIVKWLFGLLAAIILIGISTWFMIRRYRQRLTKQIAQNKMNARLNELETKAIRSQMNPHFIFNSLNTLQRFILQRDYNNAHNYLTQFSELLRRLLESSLEDSISLEEEVKILRMYIEIEKLRFGDSFDFTLKVGISDAGNILIPFMLIQPLVENAIWHGLLPKSEEQELKINFTRLDESRILCVVDDNGVGWQYADKTTYKLKKKSMALNFIRQRLEILAKAMNIQGSLKIIDKVNKDGKRDRTRVQLIMPIIK
jgi:hypothetical protein